MSIITYLISTTCRAESSRDRKITREMSTDQKTTRKGLGGMGPTATVLDLRHFEIFELNYIEVEI